MVRSNFPTLNIKKTVLFFGKTTLLEGLYLSFLLEKEEYFLYYQVSEKIRPNYKRIKYELSRILLLKKLYKFNQNYKQ